VKCIIKTRYKNLKKEIKHFLRKKGFDKYFSTRARLARKYLSGTGLEIGARQSPLITPKRAKVEYVDIVSREESISQFSELEAELVVHVDHIADGFTLDSFKSDSYDFLIANHVLEHSPNPIEVLQNWFRVLKKGGILFCTLPIAEKTFDRGRDLTSINHFLDDFKSYQNNNLSKIKENNLEHYKEWLNISLFNSTGKKIPNIEEKAKEYSEANHEVHYHTFSSHSFIELLEECSGTHLQKLKVLASEGKKNEVITVSKKL